MRKILEFFIGLIIFCFIYRGTEYLVVNILGMRVYFWDLFFEDIYEYLIKYSLLYIMVFVGNYIYNTIIVNKLNNKLNLFKEERRKKGDEK